MLRPEVPKVRDGSEQAQWSAVQDSKLLQTREIQITLSEKDICFCGSYFMSYYCVCGELSINWYNHGWGAVSIKTKTVHTL